MNEIEKVVVPLSCPWCGKGHEDVGEFATRPHHTHRCVNDAYGKGCLKEWVLESYVFGASPSYETDGYIRKFCCPKCSASFFTSSWEDPRATRITPMQRRCQGHHPDGDGPGCGFTWSEKDDSKYFHWHRECRICHE